MKQFLRPVFNKLASMLGIPGVQDRLDALESHINPHGQVLALMERRILDLTMAQVDQVKHEIAVLSLHLENRIQSLNEALVAYIDAKQEQNKESIDAFIREQTILIAEIRQSLDTLRRFATTTAGSKTVIPGTPPSGAVSHQAVVIDDALYVALENHFRGSRDMIAQRQSDYLPMLPNVITKETPLIDLGCGRGEWLKVLRQHGVPAVGVDSNTVCIAECKEENLEVVQGDLLSFLSRQSDASVGSYTLFQVLEHLPFPVLVEVLREMRRTLVPGGRVIAEVPNAKNLRVAAGTFWIDPTHQRPLFPELLMFLATEIGFSDAKGHYANNLSPDHDLSGLPGGAEKALHSVLEAIDGPGDFALIATA